MSDAAGVAASLDQLDARLASTRDPNERLPLLLKAADSVLSIDARRATELAQEADRLAAAADDRAARAEALFLQGRCANLLLDHGTALAAYGEALCTFESTRDDNSIAKTLREISFVHDALGDYPRALDYQFRALELDERTGNSTSRAATLRTIGIVYSRSGDPAAGLEFYQQSLALCTTPADAAERGKTLNNIGINLKTLGRLDESLAALTEAHSLFENRGMLLQQSATLNNLGLVRERLGDATRAEATLHAALDLAEATGYRHGVADASLSLGKLCSNQRRHDEARHWLEAALDVCVQHRLKPTQYECHEALALLHEQMGEPVEALAHFRRFHELEREVQSEDASCKMRALQIQFHVASAKREAESQREREKVLTEANAELEALNISLTEVNLQKTMLLDQLERQTYEDALTGLANRRRLDQRLADEFSLALRHKRPLAVAIADLDHFKTVNDRYSHAVGDAVLRELAKLLTAQVRHTDLVARFGGEEFVLVFAETEIEAALAVCEKLRNAVADHAWRAIHPGLSLTLSIGVCADTGLPGHDRMLAVADRNLYRAKASGRNRVVG